MTNNNVWNSLLDGSLLGTALALGIRFWLKQEKEQWTLTVYHKGYEFLKRFPRQNAAQQWAIDFCM